MNWDALQTSALLGTERRTYRGTLPLLADPEAHLLSDAAALALQRKAGRLPAARAPNPPPPCPEDAQSAAAYSPHLRTLLENRTHGTLLAQWLDYARRAELRVPERSLPDLLDYGRHSAELRPAILSVLGERGRWLARLNQAWFWALRPLWAVIDGEIVPEVRGRDPAHARALVEGVWQHMSAETRAELVAYLGVNLSLEDEPFLERALDDRSKNVRGGAARLLSHLSASALSRRMTGRADALLNMEQAGSQKVMTLNLLPQTDETLLRDGVEPEGARGESKRALTRQVLAGVPLEHLTERFSERPGGLIDAAKRNKGWGTLILEAWLRRTLFEANVTWARAFFEKRLEIVDVVEPALPSLFHLNVPAEARDAFLLGEIERNDSPPNSNTLADLPQLHPGAWSPALTATVLKGLQTDLRRAKLYSPKLQSFYAACAYHMHPETLQAALRALTLPPETPNWIDTVLAHMRDVADLRSAILEEF